MWSQLANALPSPIHLPHRPVSASYRATSAATSPSVITTSCRWPSYFGRPLRGPFMYGPDDTHPVNFTASGPITSHLNHSKCEGAFNLRLPMFSRWVGLAICLLLCATTRRRQPKGFLFGLHMGGPVHEYQRVRVHALHHDVARRDQRVRLRCHRDNSLRLMHPFRFHVPALQVVMFAPSPCIDAARDGVAARDPTDATITLIHLRIRLFQRGVRVYTLAVASHNLRRILRTGMERHHTKNSDRRVDLGRVCCCTGGSTRVSYSWQQVPGACATQHTFVPCRNHPPQP